MPGIKLHTHILTPWKLNYLLHTRISLCRRASKRLQKQIRELSEGMHLDSSATMEAAMIVFGAGVFRLETKAALWGFRFQRVSLETMLDGRLGWTKSWTKRRHQNALIIQGLFRLDAAQRTTMAKSVKLCEQIKNFRSLLGCVFASPFLFQVDTLHTARSL